MDDEKKKEPNLLPRHKIFLEEFLKHGNGAKAAIAAGYPPKFASQAAWRLLNRVKGPMEVMAATRKAVQEKMNYTLETAMKETDDAIAFAKETDNANAYSKVIELRAKLNGLLVEKVDVRSLASFEIRIRGIDDPVTDVSNLPAGSSSDASHALSGGEAETGLEDIFS